MNRKTFLRNTGLLVGGAALFSSFKNKDNPGIKIGIIGAGDRGMGIAVLLKEMAEQFKVVAFCDTLSFRLEGAKKDFSQGVKYYADYRELLVNKDIDAVVIATPLYNHFEIAKASLEAGKHVYLEKTMVYNDKQALELVATSKQYAKQVLQIGHQYRYTPLYFRVKEMIESGYLGKITQIDCRWDRNWNWRRSVPAGYTDQQVNWRMYKKYSGGLVAELLSHQIDFINWAFDTHPDEVMGTGGIDFYKDGRETYDNVQVILRYKEKGMIANFGATCGNAKEGYIFKIKGTKGMISLLPTEGLFYPEAATKKELETVDGVTGATKITWNKDGGIPITQEKLKDGTWYALKEFYACITQQQQPVSNVFTGARTAICVHMANEAIYNHAIKKWKKAYTV